MSAGRAGLTLVTDPIDRKRRPQTPHEARFSLLFGVARHLRPWSMSASDSLPQERLNEEAVLRLASLVEASVDPDSDYPGALPRDPRSNGEGGKTYRVHVPFHPASPKRHCCSPMSLTSSRAIPGWLFGEQALARSAKVTARHPRLLSAQCCSRSVRASSVGARRPHDRHADFVSAGRQDLFIGGEWVARATPGG